MTKKAQTQNHCYYTLCISKKNFSKMCQPCLCICRPHNSHSFWLLYSWSHSSHFIFHRFYKFVEDFFLNLSFLRNKNCHRKETKVYFEFLNNSSVILSNSFFPWKFWNFVNYTYLKVSFSSIFFLDIKWGTWKTSLKSNLKYFLILYSIQFHCIPSVVLCCSQFKSNLTEE